MTKNKMRLFTSLLALCIASMSQAATIASDAFLQSSYCKAYKCKIYDHKDNHWTYLDRFGQLVMITRSTSDWASSISSFSILEVQPDIQYSGDDNKEFKALQFALLGKLYADLDTSCYTETNDTNRYVLGSYSNKGKSGEFYCSNGHYSGKMIMYFGLKMSK